MSAPGGTLIAEAAALTPARKRWTLLAVILGSGIVFLDTSVVNLALPRIGGELFSDLFGTLEAQSYVANGYFVTLSALLILAGALSDYFGRRRMFAIGLAGFAATSLLCGIAPSMEFLIVCRILQGAAGAILVPGSLAIITATFQGEEQGRAFGLWAGASAATTILGPFVGGLLVNTISWRMAFLINLPFLLIAYLATVRYVPESRNEQATGRFDWLGSLVVAVAVAGLAFGTVRGQQHGWHEPIAEASCWRATRAMPRRSSRAVRTTSTRLSVSSTQSTGTSWMRRPPRWAASSSSVSKNQAWSSTVGSRARTTSARPALKPHWASLKRARSVARSSRL
jgi:MFS family permease